MSSSLLAFTTAGAPSTIGRHKKNAEEQGYTGILLLFHDHDSRDKVQWKASLDLGVVGTLKIYEGQISMRRRTRATLCHNELDTDLPSRLSLSTTASTEVGMSHSHELDRTASVTHSILITPISDDVAAGALGNTEYSDLWASAQRADAQQSNSCLWPALFRVHRKVRDPVSGTFSTADPRVLIGRENVWESLSEEEKGAFNKVNKSGARSAFGKAVKHGCVRDIGSLFLAIDRMSCCDFLNLQITLKARPEQIVGVLKVGGKSYTTAVSGWACYRYGKHIGQDTVLSGFAIGPDGITTITKAYTHQIRTRLRREGMQAIFTGAQQAQWVIRRVGWNDLETGDASPLSEEQYYWLGP